MGLNKISHEVTVLWKTKSDKYRKKYKKKIVTASLNGS